MTVVNPLGGSVDVAGILAPWRRRKWLVSGVFAVVLAGAIGLAAFLPNLYQSTATILIERPQVSESFVRSAVTIDLETRLQTIREQITSRSRLWSVIMAHDLYPELRAKQPPEVVVAQMRRDLSVEMKGVENRAEPGSTITLAVSYRGGHPKTVASVANALAGEYVEENSKTRERHARGTSEFLKSQLDQAKTQLEGQEARLNAFRMRFGNELPSGREAALSALERMGTQLDRNAESQARVKDRMAMLERDAAAPPPPLPDGSESDEARLAKLQAQLTDLRQRYTEGYPDVVAAKQELAAVQRRLRQSSGSIAAAGTTSVTPSAARTQALRRQMESDLKSLRDEERRLQPSILSYQSRVERGSARDIELEQLSRDYVATREQYDSLLKRYNDAALAERVELRSNGEEFSILDSAVAPTQPTAPHRTRLYIMALAFALGVTVGVMLLVHWLDGALHTSDEVRSMTTLPILASVPTIVTAGDRTRGLMRTALAAVALVLAVVVAFGGASMMAGGNESIVRMLSRGAS